MTPQEKAQFQSVFKNPDGMAVLYDILEECGVFNDNFFGEKPHTTAYYSGKRAVGLSLLEKMEECNINLFRLGEMKNAGTRPARSTDTKPGTDSSTGAGK